LANKEALMPYRSLFILFFLTLFACVPADDQPGSPDGGLAPDAETVDLEKEEILRGYSQEVWDYTRERMPGEWWAWMVSNSTCYDPAHPYAKDCPYEWYQSAYVRARRADPSYRRLRIEVSYEAPIAYDPPWPSEDAHMQALKLMAELMYPGWEFSFSLADPEAEFHMVLGHAGISFADRGTIYLVYEAIFGHEFGHLLGLSHHYCAVGDSCQRNYPPGEGPCIMTRESSSWGPTEQFLLQLGPDRFDKEIDAAAEEIMRRYPASMRAAYELARSNPHLLDAVD
jgi:hypothetical protein